MLENKEGKIEGKTINKENENNKDKEEDNSKEGEGDRGIIYKINFTKEMKKKWIY